MVHHDTCFRPSFLHPFLLALLLTALAAAGLTQAAGGPCLDSLPRDVEEWDEDVLSGN